MSFYTNEDRKKEIEKEVQSLRAAASNIYKLKKVVISFDGKVYNCRFDNAIKEISDDNNRFYCSNYYDYFHLVYYEKTIRKDITLLSCQQAKKDKDTKYFDANKRIKADEIITALNEKYSDLLKRATELEQAIQELQEKILQLETLKKYYNSIVDGIPSEITSVYNLKRIY